MRKQKTYQKPLFIPLNTEYYEAFEDGSKTVEYRLNGKRWNEGTCWEGRAVTLSKGYGKKNRLHGVVKNVWTTNAISLNPETQADVIQIYGPENHKIICIEIELP